MPRRSCVIGGGAIGCEFASTFADLGSQVTILEGLPKILPGLDADLANVVVRIFKKKDIDIKTGVKVTGHTPNGIGGTTVHFGDDGESLEVDAVVVSVGRRPFADQLGLQGTGVKVDRSGLRRGRRVLPHRRAGRATPSATSSTPRSSPTSATPRRSSSPSDILGESPDAGELRPGAVGHLLPPRGRLGRPGRGGAQGRRPRRRRRQAPVPRQQPGPDPRRDSTAW